MTANVAVVTQARTNSTRLPAKVLERAAGTTMLEHHLLRLRAADLPVVVATTDHPRDDAIVEIAEAMGVHWFRGSEPDVLDRFARCAEAYDLDGLVRVTSDCPLVDGHLVARAVEEWRGAADPWLYLSNALVRTFPRGLDLEVFSTEALLLADREASSAAEREHVTPYLYGNAEGRFRLENLAFEEDASHLRITLDTPEDLTLLRRMIEDHDATSLDVRGLVDLLLAHPELRALNADVRQKELHDSGTATS
ncbi:MAG: glycosyltransferase family protein [Nocardioidaceae bacterium]|nr:glycosyltransferase family protein [Nocardioidaceae bacterium]NUS49790.1 glycosyltransferase family protein [Nocardioidaceae bacterium]